MEVDYQTTINFYDHEKYTESRSDIYAVSREAFFDGLSDLLARFSVLNVLEIGAGPGLEAKMFSDKGYHVTAVEPCAAFRNGKILAPNIKWVDDRLPDLRNLVGQEHSFDLVFSSATFMHVHPEDQERALMRMLGFLSDRGILYMTIRNGSSPDARQMYPVSYDVLSKVAARQGRAFHIISDVKDHRGRPDVTWTTLTITPL